MMQVIKRCVFVSREDSIANAALVAIHQVLAKLFEVRA
jgi:hypothetical protein